MFRRLVDTGRSVQISIDGKAVTAKAGDSVMAALLLNGVTRFHRSNAGNDPRGPYCGMGVCFDCLVTIDGEGGRQACLTQVMEGMVIQTGDRRRDIVKEGTR